MIAEAHELEMMIKERTLFKIKHFSIQQHDRIGLVGRNGSGKSTLLDLLTGKRQPTKGTVHVHATCELLPQLKEPEAMTSGGEVTQAYINDYLSRSPQLLLADEPTTHLDTERINQLEQRLQKWKGAFVIVSHDRAFLDALCTTIWEIENEEIKIYPGNYSAYVEQKEIQKREQRRDYERYMKKKKQLEAAIELKEQKAQRATKKPKNLSATDARALGVKTHYANQQKKLRQSVKAFDTRLNKLNKVEKIKEQPKVNMQLINEDQLKGRTLLQLDHVNGKVEQRLLWKTGHVSVKSGDKIVLLGDNGSGKTTLIKTILRQDKGITISPAAKIGYFSQNIDVLNVDQSILENVSSTSIQSETFMRTVLAQLHFFGDDVYKKVNVLSGGERVKVSFAKLFVSHVNFLILDEPTTFLDLESIEALEQLLQDYKGTILFVSHDRQFIQHIATRIFKINNKTLITFNGTYEEFQQSVNQNVKSKTEEILILETKIAEVISRLSIEPSEALEEAFQELLKKKKDLELD